MFKRFRYLSFVGQLNKSVEILNLAQIRLFLYPDTHYSPPIIGGHITEVIINKQNIRQTYIL